MLFYVVEEAIAMGQLIGCYGPMSPSGESRARPWRVGDEPVGVAPRTLNVGDTFVVTSPGTVIADVSDYSEADPATIIQG